MSTATAEPWPCTAEEYHADRTAISHSAKEVFRRSPRLYHGVYIAGTIPPPEPTDAMQLGTLLHLAVLEPQRWSREVVAIPKVDRRTKDGKAAWQAFCESVEADGKRAVDAEHLALVEAMAGAIRGNRIAARLLDREGQVEHAIRWQCAETGLWLKARRDFVDGPLIVDVKTCRAADHESFAKAATALGYHRQAAHYLDGHEALIEQEAAFVFVAVEKQQPFTVACYELDEAALELGRAQNRSALLRLRECLERGCWEAPHEGLITTLSLPRWASYHDYDQVSGDE